MEVNAKILKLKISHNTLCRGCHKAVCYRRTEINSVRDSSGIKMLRNGDSMKKDLLHTPEGVRDIYNGECARKIVLQNRLHDVCALYGYNDIQTPSFEFF